MLVNSVQILGEHIEVSDGYTYSSILSGSSCPEMNSLVLFFAPEEDEGRPLAYPVPFVLITLLVPSFELSALSLAPVLRMYRGFSLNFEEIKINKSTDN